ncbi:hypothetical protein [uncultured Winogradskyella sp.]|uniref:hypothetical protein n=1 Tax=uncultured Winogradskyella sp. TaxID=395353 RepID=UPI00261858E2|nr:hypothetical protein [uncultured Winogradskyella sp.]
MRKTIYLSIYFLFLLNSCKGYKVFYDNNEPSAKETELINKYLKPNKKTISFTDGFQNHKLKIKLSDNSEVFNGVINTDETLGLAKTVYFNKEEQYILIFIDGKKLKIKNQEGYSFIYVSNNDNEVHIEFKKAPYIFS